VQDSIWQASRANQERARAGPKPKPKKQATQRPALSVASPHHRGSDARALAPTATTCQVVSQSATASSSSSSSKPRRRRAPSSLVSASTSADVAVSGVNQGVLISVTIPPSADKPNTATGGVTRGKRRNNAAAVRTQRKGA
jgi:hypothetical protein